MEDNISSIIIVVTTIIIFGVLVGLLGYNFYYSKKIIDNYQEEKWVMQEDSKNAMFQQYDNKEIKSSDIVDLIMNYNNYYEYSLYDNNGLIFELKDNSLELKDGTFETYNISDLSRYSYDYLTKHLLKDYLYNEFNSEIIYYDYTNDIKGFMFTIK